MDALMRMMRQTHHDPMTTSMFDAEALSDGGGPHDHPPPENPGTGAF
jgi:hypothetical protein